MSKAFNSLSPLQYESTQNDTFKQHFAGSLAWFFERPEFQSWLSGDGKILFCPGIPGAGKTVLAATVVHYLHEHIAPDADSIALSWTYFSFKARASQTPQNVLGSICAQFARKRIDLTDKVVAAYRIAMSKNEKTNPDTIQLLREFLSKYTKVYLIMDAMDEYSEDDMGWLEVFDPLRKLTGHLNIIVTSRPIASIEREFAAALKVEILAHEADILSYVHAGLEQRVFKKHTSADRGLETYIEQTLLQKVKECKSPRVSSKNYIYSSNQVPFDQTPHGYSDEKGEI